MALAATAMPAHAQQAPPEEEAGGIPEIIVTAEKRETSLQSTPLAISAISADQLREQNVENLMDIGALAPNVMAGSQSATGGQNGGFFIRGIGQDRSGITFDQGVGVYVDDVYMSRSDASFLSIIDVDRIEVLRGPQGTLFGKNTIGGAIRYITKQPDDEFSGFIDGTIGSYDRLDVKGSVNIPLSESLFVKATFGALNRDGFLDHVADDIKDGDEDVRYGRLQVRALLGDSVTLDLSASKTVSKNNGRAYITDFIDPNDTFIVRFTTKTGIPFDSRYVSPDNHTRYGGDDTGYRYDGYMLSAVLSADLSDALTVKSITSYMGADVTSKNDWDGTGFSVYDIRNDRSLDQFSQELQVLGSAVDSRLNYVLGVYYLRETPYDFTTVNTAFDSQFPAPRRTNQEQKVDSYAAFAQATFDVTEQLSITGGLRYSKDKKEATSNHLVTGYSGSGQGSWDDFSPRVSVEYQWSPTVMTYAAVTKGFRSGGINVLTSGPVDYSSRNYDPETVWNYEAGIRTDLLDRRVRFNVTGFHMEYKDQQLTALNTATNVVYIQNVGKAHRTGLEIETAIVPVDGLKLQGNLGYLESQYDDVGSATGVSESSRVLRSPKWTYTVGGSYEIPIGEGNVTPSLSYNYRSKQSTTSTDGNSVLLDGYGTLSARIQYNAPDDRWSLAAFATNVTDKTYFIGGIDFARRESLIGVSQLDVGRPREFGVNLRYNF
ncbi:MAG: TonB-dependent receptor [Altererythrobacter sp.]|nr:TonB-dependent receptor [Altererythrobacter sp.]